MGSGGILPFDCGPLDTSTARRQPPPTALFSCKPSTSLASSAPVSRVARTEERVKFQCECQSARAAMVCLVIDLYRGVQTDLF